MATRRYHKKRVIKHSRKSGKVGRKSRRVRKMKGGNLFDKDGNLINYNSFSEYDKTDFVKKINESTVKNVAGIAVFTITVDNSDPPAITFDMKDTILSKVSKVVANINQSVTQGINNIYNASTPALTHQYRTPLEKLKDFIQNIYVNNDHPSNSRINLSNITKFPSSVILKYDNVTFNFKDENPTILTPEKPEPKKPEPDKFIENLFNAFKSLNEYY
jgi:hypothetical protein